jgi:hypothetical protein
VAVTADLEEEIRQKKQAEAEDALSLLEDDASRAQAQDGSGDSYEASSEAVSKSVAPSEKVSKHYGDWRDWPSLDTKTDEQVVAAPKMLPDQIDVGFGPGVAPPDINPVEERQRNMPGAIDLPSVEAQILKPTQPVSVSSRELDEAPAAELVKNPDYTPSGQLVTPETPPVLPYVRRAELAKPLTGTTGFAVADPDPDNPDYKTPLSPSEEKQFRSWVKANKIPFDDSPSSDYDMRGFWKAAQEGDPDASTAVSKFDGRIHFSDKFKTPFHRTFSNESQYATSDAPHWEGDRLIDNQGNVVADETPPTKNVPGFISGSKNAILNPEAGLSPKQAYPEQIVSPEEKAGTKSVVDQPALPATTTTPQPVTTPAPGAKEPAVPTTAQPDNWKSWLTEDGTVADPTFKPDVKTPNIQPGTGSSRVQEGASLKGTNPVLTEIVSAAANALPEGYTIRATSGVRTTGQGQHTLGKAQDWQIYGPDGKPIVNRGDDATGLYTLLARNAYGYQEKYHPELTGLFQWGGQFGTSTANNPNEPDLMHFDIGGRRGRIERYSRESIGAALPPGEGAGPAQPEESPLNTLVKLDSSGLNVTHFGYKGDANLDSDSAAGHGKYVSQMIPGYDVALNAAAARLVGNPQPGETFQYAGREWRYGDKVPEKYSDARFDIYDQSGNILTGDMPVGKAGAAAAAAGPKKEDWESWDTIDPAVADAANKKLTEEVNAQAAKLDAFKEAHQNIGEVLQMLDKPASDNGVTPEVQQAWGDDFKKSAANHVRDVLQQPKLTDEQALAKARENPLLGSVGEVMSKWIPNIKKAGIDFQSMLLITSDPAGPMGKRRIEQFAHAMEPNATPAQIKEFIDHLYNLPPDVLAQTLSIYANDMSKPGPQGPSSLTGPTQEKPYVPPGSIDIPALIEDVKAQGNPAALAAYKAREATVVSLQAEAAKQLRSSPNFEGTPWQNWTQLGGQAPVMIAQMLTGPAGEATVAAQILQQSKEDIKREHPFMSEEDIDGQASASTLLQLAPQLLGFRAMGGKLGALTGVIKNFENPLVRIGSGATAHFGVTVAASEAQKIAKNVAEGRNWNEGLGQNILEEGIPGLIGGGLATLHRGEPPPVSPLKPPPPEEPPLIKPEEKIEPPDPTRPPPPPDDTRRTEQEPPPPIDPQREQKREPDTPTTLEPETEPEQQHADQQQAELDQQNKDAYERDKAKVEGRQVEEPPPESSGLEMEAKDAYGNVIGKTEARKGRSSARTTVGEMLDAGGDSAVLAQKALDDGWSRDDPMPKPGEQPPIPQPPPPEPPVTPPEPAKEQARVEKKAAQQRESVASDKFLTEEDHAQLKPDVEAVQQAHREMRDNPTTGNTKKYNDTYGKLQDKVFAKFKPIFDLLGINSAPAEGPFGIRTGFSASTDESGFYRLNHDSVANAKWIRDKLDDGTNPAQMISKAYQEELMHFLHFNTEKKGWQKRIKEPGAKLSFIEHIRDSSKKAFTQYIRMQRAARARGDHATADAMWNALRDSAHAYDHPFAGLGYGSAHTQAWENTINKLWEDMRSPDLATRGKAVIDAHSLYAELVRQTSQLAHGTEITEHSANRGVWKMAQDWWQGVLDHLTDLKDRLTNKDDPLSKTRLAETVKGVKKEIAAIDKQLAKSKPATVDLASEIAKAHAAEDLLSAAAPGGLPPKPKKQSWEEFKTKMAMVFKSGESAMLDNPETRTLAFKIKQRPSIEQRLGADTEVHKVYDAMDAAHKANPKTFHAEWEAYHRAEQSGQPLPAVAPETRAAIDAWKNSASKMFDEMERLNTKVVTSKGNIRPARRIGANYWPRMLSDDFKDIVANRNAHRAGDWQTLVNKEIAAGHIKNEQEMLDKYAGLHHSDETSNEPFSNMERARELNVAHDYYDFSPKAAIKYLNRGVKRLATIEAFGQKLSNKGKDYFDHSIDDVEKSTTLTGKQKEAVRNRINQERAAEYQQQRLDNTSDWSDKVRTFATGAQLGNPITSLMNLIGGGAHNLIQSGPVNFLKTVGDMPNFNKLRLKARELNILRANMRDVMHDMELTQNQTWATRKIQGFTKGMLKWGGQHLTEDINRVFAMQNGKNWLNDWSRNFGRNNAKGRAANEQIQRLGFAPGDLQSLYNEHGTGTLSDDFLRQWVMQTHGNYGPSQTAAHIFHSPVGKALLQYQQWGANASRFLTREFIAPLTRSTVNLKSGTSASRADFTYHLGRNIGMIGTMVGSGALAVMGRNMILGRKDQDPTAADIIKRVQIGDYGAALGEALQKSWSSIIASGIAGSFGNYADLLGSATQGTIGFKTKDPRVPASMQPITSLVNLANSIIHEGKPSPKAVDDFFSSLLSQYKYGSEFAKNVASAANIPTPWNIAKAHQADQDLNFLRIETRQYEKESPEIQHKIAISGPRPQIQYVRNRASAAKDDIHAALITGDADKVNQAINDYKNTLAVPDQAKAVDNLRSSIVTSFPIKPGGSEKLSDIQQFLQWAKDKLPEGEARRIFASAQTYAKTAVETGLFDKEKKMQYLSKLNYDTFGAPAVKIASQHAANVGLAKFNAIIAQRKAQAAQAALQNR